MGLLEVELGGMDRIGLAEDRYSWRAIVNTVMNIQVPKNAGKLPIVCTTLVSRVCSAPQS
jgi:hypothetical protein